MPILRNPRHERFAQGLALGKSASEAYVEAGYKSARRHASRLAADKAIKGRVRELQQQAADEIVLAIRQKREFLARLVRARLSETPDNSDLWQEISVTERGIKRKLFDKLRAIQIDNDLASEGSEARTNDSLADIVAALLGGENEEAA